MSNEREKIWKLRVFGTIQQMLHGTHYIGNDILTHFEEGETWRKVFGPFFVYLNSTPDVAKASNLWTDAEKQVFFFNLHRICFCIMKFTDTTVNPLHDWLIQEADWKVKMAIQFRLLAILSFCQGTRFSFRASVCKRQVTASFSEWRFFKNRWMDNPWINKYLDWKSSIQVCFWFSHPC